MTSTSYFETDFFVTGRASTAADLGVPLNGSQPFTVDTWIRFGSVQDRVDAIFQDGVFRMGALGNQVYVEISGFPGLWSDGDRNPVKPNTWHYLAAAFDGTTLRLYIDGALDCQAAMSGQGASGTQSFVLGNNLQGRLASVRIYGSALSTAQIVQAQLQPDPQQQYAANFDFTRNPPADVSGHDLPLRLEGNATVRSVVPAVSLTSTAYCQPIRDTSVNPGGQGNDPYTIQGWIFVQNVVAGGGDPLVPAEQAIFVNQALDAESGIALFLHYDTAVQAYRLASLRGSVSPGSNVLTSNATIPFAQWVNVATTYDPVSSTLSLYLDGALDKSSSSFGPIPGLPTPEILIAGAASGTHPASSWTLQGYVQSLDVWSACLSAAQVEEWQDGYPVMDPVMGPSLAAHYAFGFGRRAQREQRRADRAGRPGGHQHAGPASDAGPAAAEGAIHRGDEPVPRAPGRGDGAAAPLGLFRQRRARPAPCRSHAAGHHGAVGAPVRGPGRRAAQPP